LFWQLSRSWRNPRTGKRAARPNPRDRWEIVEVAALRIIDDELWDAVKRRQGSISFEIRRDDRGNALNRTHRRKFLFSGLLKCGCCGGGFTIVTTGRYGCATRRSKGTCNSNATVSREEIEARVLAGLKERLMAPELVREFMQAFQEEANRTATELEQQTKADRVHLDAIERKIAGLVAAVEEGSYSRTLGDRLADLERQQELLRARLSDAPSSIVRLHPRLAEIYADKVKHLETALNDPAIREEAADVLRSLIDRIELHPRPDGKGVDARLYGDLAEILAFCDESNRKEKLPKTRASRSQLSVVAGRRFEPLTFRFSSTLTKASFTASGAALQRTSVLARASIGRANKTKKKGCASRDANLWLPREGEGALVGPAHLSNALSTRERAPISNGDGRFSNLGAWLNSPDVQR
jgi:hypothetical protein